MRRILLAVVLSALASAAAAPAAGAHPLGNFSINHLVRVQVSSDRVQLHYILDQAEIPTFQERGVAPGAVLARKRAAVLQGLSVTVDGRRLPLRPTAPGTLTFPPGQGGLKLTRVELPLEAAVSHPRTVQVSDQTFTGRLGWKAVVAQPGRGTAVRSSAPSGDPTQGLRTYPKDRLTSPLDERQARLAVGPGSGTLVAPREPGGTPQTTRNRSGDRFAEVFASAAAGQGVLLFLIVASFGWGAFHALSPGHGKAMVAAYLVGTRGTARHAVGLGLTVTVTHTIGVFALGLVTLLLSQYVLPEQLYPWLTLASGLLVLLIGAQVLRSRIRVYRSARSRRAGTEHLDLPPHDHDHGHDHPHDHDHAHDHDHDEAHGHAHGGRHHDHHVPDELSPRKLVAMGASAGLIPCPSALVVLLGSIAQHQVGLGLLLIVAFSVGLAATLVVLGVLVVHAKRFTSRFDVSSPVVAALPAISALVIVGAGVMLTARAVPKIGLF